jgi:hypothetical protein
MHDGIDIFVALYLGRLDGADGLISDWKRRDLAEEMDLDLGGDDDTEEDETE